MSGSELAGGGATLLPTIIGRQGRFSTIRCNLIYNFLFKDRWLYNNQSLLFLGQCVNHLVAEVIGISVKKQPVEAGLGQTDLARQRGLQCLAINIWFYANQVLGWVIG